MAKLWDDIAKTIREGVDTVVEKTEELTKIGKIRVDILNIKRNVDKNFSELGGRVYHLLVEENKSQIATDKEVKQIVDSVKILENELNEKNDELQQVREKEEETHESKAEPSGATKSKTQSAQKTTSSKKSTASKSQQGTKS
ncbi:hypothetical protein GWO43_25810 [candidate division KSB1 bacterium]|nr:hypothetical protein [candidate division KSB1 bacterium]NIR69229.1 hypothetical protein [candidate division KSB1 bacterium]NIS27403.1 hypothetical protein [candidate division KSB1 bacterium]NIT74228.1 hypothetical protein [candidate division KSB1 bacterium]NIU28120.1 hypothetical protein [candidate division KSB1 bacterium]